MWLEDFSKFSSYALSIFLSQLQCQGNVWKWQPVMIVQLEFFFFFSSGKNRSSVGTSHIDKSFLPV